MRDSSSTKRRLLGFYPPTLWDYIYNRYYMVDEYLLDCIESSNMLLAAIGAVLLSSTTTAAGVIVPRVIAVGQHCSSAPRNPFLSQRQNVRLRGAVRLRRIWTTKAARVGLHIDTHI